MKRTLLFLLAVAFGFSAYADGYRSYNMACELYQSGRYEEAKQRFMICVRYYPDDNLEWSIIEQRVKDCDARINEEANRRKAYAAQMAKAREEERQKYEEQLRQRMERKLVYVSVNASTYNGVYPGFKEKIVGTLARYGYRTTENKDDAYWTVCVSSDVLKLSKTEENDPEHIVEVNVYYTIENVVEGVIPAGGKGGLNARGTSPFDYNFASTNAYDNLEDPLGKAIYNAIENIVDTSTTEYENVIVLAVTSNDLSDNELRHNIEPQFMRALVIYSDYKVRNFSAELRSQRAEINGIDARYSSRSAMKNAIGNDLHPRYICEVNIQKRISTDDYSLNAIITDLKTSGIEGFSFYPLNASQPPIKEKELNGNSIYNALLYIIRDLQEGVTIMSDVKYEKLKKEIADYEAAMRNIKAQEQVAQKEKGDMEKKRDRIALGSSAYCPGLGLQKKGYKGWWTFLAGDIVLIGGGVGMLTYANSQLKLLDPTGTMDSGQYKIKKNTFESIQKVSCFCFGGACLVYATNLILSYFLPNKNPNFQVNLVPYMTPIDSNMSINMGLTYKF